jgi:hypothetical protein
MIRLSLVIVLSLVSTSAIAVECRTGPGGDGKHWAWRNVDGKRCWYAGPAGASKRGLHWAEKKGQDPSSKPERRAPYPHYTDGLASGANAAKLSPTSAERSPLGQDEEEILLRSVWPALPPHDTFDKRFKGLD